jgi:hypothetical protein
MKAFLFNVLKNFGPAISPLTGYATSEKLC